MIVKSVRLKNYRNIAYLDTSRLSGKDDAQEQKVFSDLFADEKKTVRYEFSPGKNIIVGENAQGKTNFIEAINYLSCLKSFRTASEEQLIREGCDAAYLACEYKRRDHNGKIEAMLHKGGKKSIRVNGLPIQRVSELLGKINTVIFAPEDLRTLKESPGLRRRLIDIEISKVRPSYYTSLQQLNSILKNKNTVLKQKLPDRTLIEVYNDAIVAHAEKIVSMRAAYIEKLSKYAAESHRMLNGSEELKIRYRSCCDPANIKATLSEKLAAVLESERERGFCLTGPQREDFEILINEKPAKLFGSQGQQRSCMISIKLAVARIAYESTGEYPILLLDDVFSELDTKRAAALFSAIENMQVFITAAEYRSGFEKHNCLFMSSGSFNIQ